MKITDYSPRAAPFDSYLRGRDLVGAEVGVDVGAHAEALLTYCPIGMLHLIDVWPNPYCRGYCEGRLSRFRARFSMNKAESVAASGRFPDGSLDFVYVDQIHEGPSVAADLAAWWPKLAFGGVLGYRNYTGRGTALDKAVDAFLARGPAGGIAETHVEDGEIVIHRRSQR